MLLVAMKSCILGMSPCRMARKQKTNKIFVLPFFLMNINTLSRIKQTRKSHHLSLFDSGYLVCAIKEFLTFAFYVSLKGNCFQINDKSASIFIASYVFG